MGLLDILSAILTGSAKKANRTLDQLEREHPEMQSRINEKRETADRINSLGERMKR